MTFSSFGFFPFFGLLFLIYWCLPLGAQNLLLLLASYFFYLSLEGGHVALLLAVTFTTYFAAIQIEEQESLRRWYLLGALIINLGILIYFKYFAAFLPIGLSFFTFQLVGYLVDVSRGHCRVQRRPITFALFGSFFANIQAGPIERSQHLLPQLERTRSLDFDKFSSALALLLWGLAKKLLIADKIAVFTDRGFSVENTNFAAFWVGVFAYGIQIYADFSGYTDIARALARFLGIELLDNFNYPFLADSVSDYWRRWHISLSTWFRDYLYIPLVFSPVGKSLAGPCIILTFVVTGLWHGRGWNFLFFGLYFGLLVFFEQLAGPMKKHLPRPFRIAITILLVSFGWVFFRASDLSAIFHYLKLSPWNISTADRASALLALGQSLLLGIPLWLQPLLPKASKSVSLFRVVFSAAALVAILLFYGQTIHRDFVYFQF